VDGFHITGGNANDASNLVLNGTSIPRGNGAGICILNGTSAIRNNTLTNNTCSRLGGGIYVLSGIHTFSQNEISSNIAYKRGGGIYSEDASVTIHNNTIQSNSASVRGGGVYVKNDTSAITNNTIINNTGSLRGGGIYTEMTVSTLGNNTIKSNTAEYGGGIYVEVGTNTLLNNTIVQNNSSAQGGGLYTYQGSNIVKNCIFWDNMMGTATNISGADLTEYVSSNSVTYCLTQQNSLYSSGVGIVNNQDPLFSNIADIDGVDNIHRTADDGLILSCSTPAWNQQVLDIGLSTDILGVARPQRVGVRYGAYELSLGGCSFYVDASRPNNTGAGTSWATAKKDVQDAINLALAGDQVWVKAGTYKPTQAPPGCLGCEDAIMRSYTFFVKDGVSLYGGFAGTETSLSQRNIAANTTILSGEIGDLTQFGDNSFHIVMAVAPSSGGIGVTVDGFTIQGAYAARAQSITVNGVVIYCFQGGGIWIGGGANTISNNTIARNRVSNVGGGIYTLHGTHTITQNTIVANLAEGFGGGIYSDNSISNIYNNTLYDNTSNRGGGLYLNVGTNQILNNTIIGNEVTSTTSSGGGIYVGGTNSVIKNCIFWNNTVGSNSDDIGGVPIEVTHCLTQAGSSYSIGVGIINNQDPQFVNINDVDGPDDKYRTADDGLRLLPCSPAINTGTNAQVFTTTDITGAPRIQEGTVDIGAYESSSLAAYALRTDELTANATCLEGEWTHYVNTTENALLLSVKKNGNDIGSIGDGTLRVTAGGTGASRLTADDDAQENWYRTNRHWSILATHPPQTDMSVRFYYRTEDAGALMNMAGISDASDMVFYTAADGSAESMERGEAGKSVDIYTRGREASTSRWLWGISPDADSHSYAEMVVAPFEKDIDGAGAAIRKVAPSLPKDIELYPNPSRGLVQVTGVDLGGTSVTVRNVLGQEQAWVRDGNVLNLSELPAGVYFIEFAGRAGAYQIVKE
jgi:predicted outer membrane repeat protein